MNKVYQITANRHMKGLSHRTNRLDIGYRHTLQLPSAKPFTQPEHLSVIVEGYDEKLYRKLLISSDAEKKTSKLLL